jgi:PKD repeat protein
MKRNHTFRHGAAAAILLMLTGAGSASAYVLPDCWGDLKVWSTLNPTFSPAAVSFPSGTSWRTALESSFDAWNLDAPGTRFDFGRTYTSATTWSEGDGVSTVAFTSDYDWGTGTLAVELTDYDTCWLFVGGGAISESDVLFNSARTWSTTLNPGTLPRGGDSTINLKLVAIHELGHSLGYTPHEDDILATMSSFYPNSGPIGNSNDIHPHADDVLGNRVGYGILSTQRDVAASAYRRTGAGTSDVIFPPSSSPRGHKASYLFSIENRGTATESSVRVEFYLSTNRFISTGDTLLGSATYSLAPGAVGTYTATVTVPTSLAPGNYFFGTIVDPQGAIPEVDEGNNAVGHGFTTNVPSTSPPLACFSMSPSSGFVGESISFNGSCTSDPDGHSIVSYQWGFGDGSTGSGQSVSHTYFAGGNYTVRLTVTDSTGASNTTTRSLFIEGEPLPCIGLKPCEPL